jgi:hypothetical protein
LLSSYEDYLLKDKHPSYFTGLENILTLWHSFTGLKFSFYGDKFSSLTFFLFGELIDPLVGEIFFLYGEFIFF